MHYLQGSREHRPPPPGGLSAVFQLTLDWEVKSNQITVIHVSNNQRLEENKATLVVS